VGDLTLQHVVLRIGAVLLIATVHGCAVAAAATAMGDPGPRYDGRLTANPLRHLDVIGGLLTVLFTFGWIRPIDIDPGRLRFGRAGLVMIVAAGTIATILPAELLRVIRPGVLGLLPDTASATFFVFVETVGQLCVAFSLFNLLPLPPLTGQHLLVAIVPGARGVLRRIQPYTMLAIGLLIVTGVAGWLLASADAALARILLFG
jgi:Zn-dependent protease